MAKLLNDPTITTIGSLDDMDYMITVNEDTGEISKIHISDVKASIGPLVYAAIFSQASSSAPVNDFDVINTTGKTFTWARTGTGVYTLTASGAFFTGLTICLFSANVGAFGFTISHEFTSGTVLTINVRSFAGTLSDDALDHAVIKLEQYV